MATNNWPHMPGRDFVQQVGTRGALVRGLSFLRTYPRLTRKQGKERAEIVGWVTEWLWGVCGEGLILPEV